MADERLRELERAASLGDLDAGRALLLELQRRGLLDEAQLRVLAYLGYPPAVHERPHAAGPEDDDAWLQGSQAWPRAVVVRAALAVALECMGPTLAEGPPAARPRVELCSDHGARFTLPAGRSILIGSSAGVDLRIDEPHVSRQHCELTLGSDGKVRVVDLASTNGTYLGRTRIQEGELTPTNGLLLGGRGGYLSLHYVRPASPTHACLSAIQAWLDTPNDSTVQEVVAANMALTPDRVASGAALQAACQAVFRYPAQLGTRGAPANETRRIACEALTSWLLWHDSSQAHGPPPPARLAIGQVPLRRAARQLEEQYGLRAVREVRPYLFDVWSSGGGLERLKLVEHAGDGAETAERWLGLKHPGLPRALGWGTLGEGSSFFREGRPRAVAASEWCRSQSPTAVALLIAELTDTFEAAYALLGRLDLDEQSIAVLPSGKPVIQGLPGDSLPPPLLELGHTDPAYFMRFPRWYRHIGPEALDEVILTPQLAVYWLGSVLYMLWVGESPCAPKGARTTRNALKAILFEAPTPPSERGVTLDARLEAAVLRALTKTPEERQGSLTEFAAELRRYAQPA